MRHEQGSFVDPDFAELYLRHRGDVRRYVGAILRDPDDADDATQETFARAYAAGIHLAARDTPALHWLLRTARNHAIDLTRRARRCTPRAPGDIAIERDGEADPAGLPPLERGSFEEIVAPLPARQRRVLELRFVDELRPAEVASLLACTRGSVHCAQSRALSTLRRRFAPAG